MALETKYPTMCEVIKYLDGLNKHLAAYKEWPNVNYGFSIDYESNQIVAITHQYVRETIYEKYYCHTLLILGHEFYIYPEHHCPKNTHGWVIRDIETGDSSAICDILEKHGCEKDDKGSYSEADILSVLRKLLDEKVDFYDDETCLTVQRALEGITTEYDGPFYILKSEQDNPTQVFISDDFNPELGEFDELSEDDFEDAPTPDYIEITAERAAQILVDAGIDYNQAETI